MKWIESYLFKSAANSDQKIKSFKYSRCVQMWYIEKSLPAWNFHHNKNINVKYLPSINQNCLFRSIMWYKSFAHMEHHGVDCGKQARANNQRETSQNKKPSTINTVFHSPVVVLCCCLAIFPVHLHHLYHLAHKHYHTHSIDHISVCYSRLGQRAVAISILLFLPTFFLLLGHLLLFIIIRQFVPFFLVACVCVYIFIKLMGSHRSFDIRCVAIDVYQNLSFNQLAVFSSFFWLSILVYY